MWIVCITSVRHVLTVNGYGGRQTKENEKSWCFKGWETLVVNDFLELPSDQLAIYLVDFRNGETFVKRASDTEVQEMYEYGIDLFFNTET